MGIFTKAVTTLARGLGYSDPRLYQFVGGGNTDAGEPMSVDLAMQMDVVWACVRRIAETVATLPLHLYQNVDGKTSIVKDHPLYSVLHDRPNIEMTAVEYWEAKTGCYLLWGNSYSAIERGSQGQVVALTPLRPDRVQVRRQDDGSLIYIYSINGKATTYTEDEILHIKGFSLDGLMGMSPISQARQSLGGARAAERSSNSFFRNGMRPSGFLQVPKESGYLTPEQRTMAQDLIEKFKGAQNSGNVPLLEGGWDFKTLQMNAEDSQFLETRQFQVEQICRWFDVPPVLVGHTAQTTWGSGIEQIMLGWLTLGLRSHLKRIEQAVWKRLLTGAEQSRYYAEFNVDALLRADSVARAQQMASLAQNGLRNRNELRALDNLPPYDGGEEFTVQSNLLPVNMLGEVAVLPKEKPVDPGSAIVPSGSGANIPKMHDHTDELKNLRDDFARLEDHSRNLQNALLLLAREKPAQLPDVKVDVAAPIVNLTMPDNIINVPDRDVHVEVHSPNGNKTERVVVTKHNPNGTIAEFVKTTEDADG